MPSIQLNLNEIEVIVGLIEAIEDCNEEQFIRKKYQELRRIKEFMKGYIE